MNFTVKYHDIEGYYETTLRQNVNMETILAIQDSISKHKDYVTAANIMWDARAADVKELTMQDMMGGLTQAGFQVSKRAAVVFKTDFQLAITKQAIAFADVDPASVLITSDYLAAQQWLDTRKT